MSERCELCGARRVGNATVCHECGAPTVVAGTAAVGQPPTAHAVSSVASGAGDAPSTPRPRLGLIVGVAALLLAAIGIAVMMAGSEPEASASDAAAACPETQALAGSWVFTTVTTGARKNKRLGMRGYYELEVTLDQCEPTAALTKVGRTGAETYDDAHKHRATAALTRGDGPHAFGFGAVFEPRNEAGQGIPKRFVFAVDGDRLVGTWRQRGSRWKSSGQFGVVEGRRDGDPRELRPRKQSLPCNVACAVPKDIEAADAEAEVTGLDDCLALCR